MRPLARMRCRVGSIASGSMVSGLAPSRPSEDRAIGAVAASGEGERAVELRGDLRGALEQAARSRSSTKSRAAFIGPMVWELEGPMPTLKMSKTLKVKMTQPRARALVQGAATDPAESAVPTARDDMLCGGLRGLRCEPAAGTGAAGLQEYNCKA